ncbi:MAG: cellulase family glycosylhydrolase [Ruminococcus sp.]|nr:cellulase family glycosylhydrolase [Ruminococcus sp.]
MAKTRFARRAVSLLASVAMAATMVTFSPSASAASMSSTTSDFLTSLGAGWCLGNSLDATGSTTVSAETSWGNPKTTQAMIQAVQDAGFDTVRIPVSWGKHTSGDDYTIDSAWMARVKEVVDYAYGIGMNVILNVHHDNSSASDSTIYYYPDSEHEEQSLEFLTSVWSQISEEFADYDEHLVFETLNEPRLVGTDYEWWFTVSNPGDTVLDAVDTINTFNQEIVNTIRESGGNNETRYIMCPGYSASLIGCTVDGFELPDDPKDSTNSRILLSIHGYTPYNLCLGSSTDITSATYTTLSSSGKSEIDSLFSSLYTNFVSKGIGVVMGETGISDKNNNEARVEWAKYFYSYSKKYNIPTMLWDNNAHGGSTKSENHMHLKRSTCKWIDPDVITAIMDTMGVTDYTIAVDSSVVEKSEQTISGTSSYTKTFGDSAFTLDASAEGTLSYSSSDTSIALVTSAGKVTIKGVGTATITVTAAETSSYKSATKTITIKVNKKTATPTISAIADQTCTGSAITPKLTVKVGSTYLSTSNYTATYSNNVKIGTATVKVTLKNNYSGSATATFNIVSDVSAPGKVTVKSSYSKTTSAVRINWNKVTNADGYRIYRYNSSTKKWVKIKTIQSGSTTTYRDSGLKAGTTYKYCVKAFTRASDGTAIWGVRSATKVTATKPNTVKFKSATKTKTTVTLNWKKVTGSGYKLQQYDFSTKKWKTIKVISSSSTTTYKVTGLKKGTVYKFRIQAYKKASSSVKTYSAWSATKKVTTKS